MSRPFEPSLGVRRRLDACSSPGGRFTMLAIDHRQNLKRVIGDDCTDRQLIDFKLQVMQALGSEASSVLTDPEYGAAQAIAAGALSGSGGLILAVEATGYVDSPAGRVSRILDGWSVEQAMHLGADGVKLLVYYHPRARNASAQEDLVARVTDECADLDLPLFVEPLSYSLDGETLEHEEFTDVVVETASRLTEIGGDVLKAEFPERSSDVDLWRKTLDLLDSASLTPWVILSGGVDFETFHAQAEAAAAAGGSGVMVGRAVWNEALALDGGKRRSFLETTATDRLRRLDTIEGPGWRDRAPAVEIPGPEWFR